IQSLGSRSLKKRHRRRISTLRTERMGRKAGRRHQRVAGSTWRIRSESSFAAVAGVPECTCDATAGSLSRRSCPFLRWLWKAGGREDARISEQVSAVIRGLDRGQPTEDLNQCASSGLSERPPYPTSTSP